MGRLRLILSIALSPPLSSRITASVSFTSIGLAAHRRDQFDEPSTTPQRTTCISKVSSLHQPDRHIGLCRSRIDGR